MHEVTVQVHGRTRRIRNIRENTGRSFFAYYAGYSIHVWIDEDDRCYAACTHPDGGRIVDGYVEHGRGTIETGIVMCMENIFRGEVSCS
jgi:hypothetical protein